MEPKSGNDRRQSRVVRREELGELIRTRRKQDRLTLEQAAQECGVSAATLWRLEKQGMAVAGGTGKRLPEPDTMTLGAVTRWLGVSLDRIVETSITSATDSIAHGRGDSTPDIIEAHLRADRKLDPQAAAALGRMFRLAYEQFQHSSGSSATPISRYDDNKQDEHE